MGHIGEQIVTIATLIVGVAIVAVIVSRNSNTANVVTSAGNAFANALGVAVSPVTGFTGGASNFNFNAPTNFGYNLPYN